MRRDLVAFTPICEPDARWIDQYLAEVERLDVGFGVHFDRCSPETKRRMGSHSNCVAWTYQDDPTLEYTEQHKQVIFDLVCEVAGVVWALHWDADEIWEDEFIAKFLAVKHRLESHLTVSWANMWETPDRIRSDDGGPGKLMAPAPRVKLYRIDDERQWVFDHPVIYGCKEIVDGTKVRKSEGKIRQGATDIVCLHAGLMTHELRLQHAERWDRIYGAAVGENPYKLWHALMDHDLHPPATVPNVWLSDSRRVRL